MYYTASGIITLKQVSGLKLLKITKITKIYKYKHILKFMCEFFGCDYCVLLTINMLWLLLNWLRTLNTSVSRTDMDRKLGGMGETA